MKKIISVIALTAILGLALAPALVLADEEIPKGCGIIKEGLSDTCDAISSRDCTDIEYDPNCGICCLLQTIDTVTNWLFYLLMILVTLMIIYGGFTYMTAAGDPEKAGKAKGILTFAIIGFAIALLAKFIPSIVRAILGI